MTEKETFLIGDTQNWRNSVRKFLVFFFVFSLFAGGYSTFASSNSVQMFFGECTQNTCIRLSQESNTQAFFPVMQAGQSSKISVNIANPAHTNVYSVESWMQFDPSVIAVKNLSSQGGDFPLEAPGEFEVDASKGVIKIGRAIAGAPVTKDEIKIATFEITALKNTQGSKISFIDYRTSDVGKTAVLTINNMLPENILTQKPKDLAFGNGATHNASNQYTVPNSAHTQQNGTNVYGVDAESIPSFIDIPRPTGLRSRTYLDGKTEHLWKIGADKRISGYYLYYSTTSGQYMHRRDMGKTNIYQFPAGFFEKGKRMYFSVQAYDRSGKLSDFSDETYLTVGAEGSESHPFFEQIFPNVQLDKDGKAYRIIKNKNGQQVSVQVSKDAKGNRYSANLSQKYPRKTTQSGTSDNILFIILGGGFLLFGMRKMYTLQKQKKHLDLLEKHNLIKKFNLA